MRRIVAGLFISLDGVVEAPKKWHLRYFTDEMGEIIDTAAEHSDAVLRGRRTYEEFGSFWPVQGSEVPLDALEWASSSLITGDVAQQIGVLKGQRGKNIQVIGSATLVRFLLRALSSGVMALSYAPARNGARRHTSFRPAVSSKT